MDPTENLRRQLEISCRLLAEETRGEDFNDLADELAYLVVSLDQWITQGGFLPKQWGAK